MIAGSIASFAAVVKDTEVTVNGLLPNDVVKFYQVLTWNQTAGEWQLAEGFTTLKLTDNASETQADTVAAIVDGITQAEARKIAALTNLASGGPTAKNTVTVGEGGTSATYAIPTGDENLGLYMGVITAGDPGYIYNPVFMAADFTENDKNTIAVSAKYADSSSVAKKQPLEVTKTTKDTEEAWAQAIDSYVGQEVDFKVIRVPSRRPRLSP